MNPRHLLGTRDERGVVMVLTSLFIVLVLIAASFAIDLGERASSLRTDHLVADLAALDAVRVVSSGQSAINTAASTSASRNGFSPVIGTNLTATPGHYPNGGPFTTTCSGTCDAVKVVANSTTKDFFAAGSGHLTATAIAQLQNQAKFQVGSTLVDINAGLGPFGAARLDAVGYNGLLSGSTTLAALGTALGVNVLTTDNVLNDTVTVAQLVNAAATLLASSNPTASSDLSILGANLSGAYSTANTIKVGDALGLSSGNGAGLDTAINLLQLVQGGIQLANGKAGISSNLSTSGLSSIASVSETVSAIVPPTISNLGQACPASNCATATNTQVTVTVTIKVSVLGLLTTTLPFTLTLGGATGTLDAVNCGSPKSISIASTFQPISLTLSSPASVNALGLGGLLGGLLGTVSGSISIDSSNPSDAVLNNPANFASTTPQVPVTRSASLSTVHPNLVGGGGLLAGTLATITNTLIANVLLTTTPVISSIVNSVSSAVGGLGINTSSADYLGIQQVCGTPVVVQ